MFSVGARLSLINDQYFIWAGVPGPLRPADNVGPVDSIQRLATDNNITVRFSDLYTLDD